MICRPITIPDVTAPTLADAPISPQWIIAGQPSAQAERLVRSHDRTVSFVVWACTRGTFRWHYDQEESFVVVAGEVFITNEGEPEYRLGPGDMAYCPPGSSCTWRIPNYVKKIAILRGDLPLPVSLFARVWHRLVIVLRQLGGHDIPSPPMGTSGAADPVPMLQEPPPIGGPRSWLSWISVASGNRKRFRNVY